MAATILSASRLREVLNYDPETGVFTRRIDAGNRALAGTVAGTTSNSGYRIIRVDFKRYSEHRLAWLYVTGAWPSMSIDHMDGSRDNNRFTNLRNVSRSVNAQNQHGPQRGKRGNTSGFLGVSWDKDRSKWTAMIFVAGKLKRLGLFIDPANAYVAYLTAKRALHEGCTI